MKASSGLDKGVAVFLVFQLNLGVEVASVVGSSQRISGLFGSRYKNRMVGKSGLMMILHFARF